VKKAPSIAVMHAIALQQQKYFVFSQDAFSIWFRVLLKLARSREWQLSCERLFGAAFDRQWQVFLNFLKF